MFGGGATIGGPQFVKPEERIAVFDNDGTLWSEQPFYFQLVFVLDRMKALAPQHPEWKDNPLYSAVLQGDLKAVAAAGEQGIITHAGMTTEEFSKIVEEWIANARQPKFDRPYTEVIFQPMLELLAYLRGNGFKTFIVSGGGVEFIRVAINMHIRRRPIAAFGNSEDTSINDTEYHSYHVFGSEFRILPAESTDQEHLSPPGSPAPAPAAASGP